MKKIIAGNWKMNLLKQDVDQYLEVLKTLTLNQDKEMILFIPSIYLDDVNHNLNNKDIVIGAQNFYPEDCGAYTGEISACMLASIGIKHVLIGHSERRKYFNESDMVVNKKVQKALANNLHPMICVGETLEEREGKLMEHVLECQVFEALKNISSDDVKNISIAYEPLWAIGTGKTATSEEAQEVCAYIRTLLNKLYGDISNEIPILYGGSVNLDNYQILLNQEDINGVLVGGASLNIDSFKLMVE